MSRRPQPEQRQAPVVQRLRLRYAKRGRMRFASHRDFARALERAIRRAEVPIAYSQGFTPHPKISYASAAPTGVASEAEYLEIGLRTRSDPSAVASAIDQALPAGLDVLDVVDAGPAGASGGLAARIEASAWRIELPGLPLDAVRAAVAGFLAAERVTVERATKSGRKLVDVRGPVVRLTLAGIDGGAPFGVGDVPCAILDLVVRQVSPTVRPDDVLAGLRAVVDLESLVPPRATRLAQGTLTVEGELRDPLTADREATVIGASSQ